jgi:hypothetical protein
MTRYVLYAVMRDGKRGLYAVLVAASLFLELAAGQV